MCGSRGLEQLDRALVVTGRVVRTGADPSHHSGALLEVRPDERLVRQLDRPSVGALRLRVRPERGRTLRGSDDHLACFRPQLLGVGVVGCRLVGVEVVRRDDLRDLVFLGAPGRGEEAGRSQVLRLTVSPRERLVGDALDDVLKERVLTSLRRARIGLDGEDLLAEQ
jgi:hypothetical protein